METVIDHLVFGVPNLDESIAWFAEQSGVTPVVGGAHEGKGTHNALVSLDSCYLEIIAPDPNQPDPAEPRPFGLDTLAGPKMLTFAIRPTGDTTLEDVATAAQGAGWDPGPVMDMSRMQPNGERLAWRLTAPASHDEGFGGAVPFLIDWGDTTNPAGTTPIGCKLNDLIIAHTSADSVAGIFRAIGLSIPVIERPTVSVSAAIASPNGKVLLR